jgi:branched-chain amino acid transport system permease protein
MELLPQAIMDGLLIGGIYITVAIGFSLVFGVMHVIDFAVGEWIMLGAFIGYYLTQWTSVEPLLYLPLVFIVFTAIGYLFQPVIHRVLSGRKGNPLLMALVFTFGLALMVRGLGLTIFGFFSRSISSSLSAGSFTLESGSLFVTVPTIRLVGLVYALGITLLLQLLLKKTDFGLAVRALAQMGSKYTVFSFFIVVLAGMGYLSGVPWAAFLLGIVQSVFLVYLDPGYTLLAVFAILYIVLLISPKGLFGKGV